MIGVNIWSGSDDELGASLTFPNELSFRKRKIDKHYPVKDKNGKVWPDAEAAYHHFKKFCKTDSSRIKLYIAIAKQKFLQHPDLLTRIEKRGGVSWLNKCCHATGAKTKQFKRGITMGKVDGYTKANKQLKARANRTNMPIKERERGY
jgi:hypothetical protein